MAIAGPPEGLDIGRHVAGITNLGGETGALRRLDVGSCRRHLATPPKAALSLGRAPAQVRSQPALECLPLVMEPESGFFWDPVLVLDFKGMYPSLMAAPPPPPAPAAIG